MKFPRHRSVPTLPIIAILMPKISHIRHASYHFSIDGTVSPDATGGFPDGQTFNK
jgi:hypothetical protein